MNRYAEKEIEEVYYKVDVSRLCMLNVQDLLTVTHCYCLNLLSGGSHSLWLGGCRASCNYSLQLPGPFLPTPGAERVEGHNTVY